MPQIAIDAGLDDKAIRRLVVLEKPMYFEVADVFPLAMQESELAQIPVGEAAMRVARRMAKEILNTGDDPLRHIRDFETLWTRSGYTSETSALGTLYDDVYIAQSSDRSEGKFEIGSDRS